MFTIKDYNLENCTFEQLTEAQKIIIIRDDIKRILKRDNEIVFCENEFSVIAKNKECFADLINIESLRQVYDELTEEKAYQFIAKEVK